MHSTHLTRRTLLRMLGLTLAGPALGVASGCRVLSDGREADRRVPVAVEAGEAPDAGTPVPGAPTVPETPTPVPVAAASTPQAAPAAVLTVAVPPTSTLQPTLPPTPTPTATPRTRPQRALLTVPYYSQHVGRQNYCLPTSIAMVADRYGRLPATVSGSPALAPQFVADVAYRLARERIAALTEAPFTALWEEIGADPLGGTIWDVFAANGRDLAAGMSPALAYLVLTYAFDLPPVLGTLDECLIALADDVPSILFGSYAPLRRADGLPPNVGGYAGPHAIVLVGVEYERVLANDPLPADKTRYSGERGRGTASARAVRFDLPSVRRMTLGEGDEPRNDCFMVAPRTA